ncbi:hypothetical protein XELAEV_18019950mg [Xenopus laevis]|uniref:Mediator of RNA polymerase II transcription subunit 7 n=1 Tax=Xenopus laevis TaxID=8355 RepID=A0A974D5Z0_XENLA|nr:hypothetical protein XELAEV_18019950mg [Xenopus laevis]
MHHLINEYRPHQARETLRVMMEVQKRQRLETAERFQKHLERVVEMIQNCLASLPDDLPLPNGADSVKTEPMDVQEPCTDHHKGSQEAAASMKEATIDKDAAMCVIIDEMT